MLTTPKTGAFCADAPMRWYADAKLAPHRWHGRSFSCLKSDFLDDEDRDVLCNTKMRRALRRMRTIP